MLSFGDVRPHSEKIKRAGALLVCQVQTLEQVDEAVSNGADVLVAQGAEGGGHGISRSTFPFVPAAVDAALDVPVAAAGGVGDGRGLAAALMLGADVLVGTRFYASQEAAGLPAAKNRMVMTTGDRTIRSILFDIARQNVWPAPYSGRVSGDFDTAAVIAGEVVDLITDIPAAAEIVQRMVTSATRLLAGASNKYRITETH
jgi:nitronate monooxygenase